MMKHMRRMAETFKPFSQSVKTGFFQGILCVRCYAVVDRENADRHERWHQELASEIEGTQQDGDEGEGIIDEARREVERIEEERRQAGDSVESRRDTIDSGGGNTTRRDPRRASKRDKGTDAG